MVGQAGEQAIFGMHQVAGSPLPCSARRSTSLNRSALIREAIDTFLHQQQPQGRLARLRQARGLWAERSDLP
jgi:hypothetical protein